MNPFSMNAQLDSGRVILTLNKALGQVEMASDTTSKESDWVDTLLCFAYHEDVMEDVHHLQVLLQKYTSLVTPGQLLDDKKQSLIQTIFATRHVAQSEEKSRIGINRLESLLFGPLHRYQSTLIPDLARNEDDLRAIETMMYNNATLMEPTNELETHFIDLFLLLRTLKNGQEASPTWTRAGCSSTKELKLWHSLLTQRTAIHQSGMFRKSGLKQARIPPAHHLIIDKIMNVLVSVLSWLEADLKRRNLFQPQAQEELLRFSFAMAAFAHYHFMDIQPFYQGNDMMARVLAKTYLDCVLPVDIPIFDHQDKYNKLHTRLYQKPLKKTHIPPSRQRTLSTTSLHFYKDEPESREYPYVPLHEDPHVTPDNYIDHLDSLSMHESIDQLYQDEFTQDQVEFESPLFAPLPIMKSLVHSAIRHITELIQALDMSEEEQEEAGLFDHRHRIVTAVSTISEFKQLIQRYAPQCPSHRFDLLMRVFESMPLHTEMDFDLVGTQGGLKANTIRVAKYPPSLDQQQEEPARSLETEQPNMTRRQDKMRISTHPDPIPVTDNTQESHESLSEPVSSLPLNKESGDEGKDLASPLF